MQANTSESNSCWQVSETALLRQWVRLLLGVWIKNGVKDVVICPGSRNAPLLQAALLEPELRCHSVYDERSAGFFALGLAKASQAPVLLVCTSGSALAHFLPAVIEAHESGVPLLVLSADRPSVLQDAATAQTIDQSRIYSSFAHTVVGWDEAAAQAVSFRALARKATQLLSLALGPVPGPAHLNLPLSKPLQLTEPESAQELALASFVEQLLHDSAPASRTAAHCSDDEVKEFLSSFLKGAGPRAICFGPLEHEHAALARKLAQALGLPVFAELPLAGSSAECENWRPQDSEAMRVLHLGRPLFSASWLQRLRSGEVQQWLLSGPRNADSLGVARRNLVADLAGTLNQCLRLLPELISAKPEQALTASAGEDAELAHRRELRACFSRHIEEEIARTGQPSEGLHELRVALCALQGLKEGHDVVLGNSLSIRLAAWAAPLLDEVKGRVYFTRGANGIDGDIAHAVGLALSNGRPTLLLLGDVSAAHDIGSLSLCKKLKTPLSIVIVDNAGGRIFDHLPAAESWSEDERSLEFFHTPPQINWQNAAAAFAVKCHTPESLEQLEAMLDSAKQEPGASVFVARCDPESGLRFTQSRRAYFAHK